MLENPWEHLENRNPANNDGMSPLHYAAENGHLDIVKYIAEHLENKNPANNFGWTPLHFAAKKDYLEFEHTRWSFEVVLP